MSFLRLGGILAKRKFRTEERKFMNSQTNRKKRGKNHEKF